MARSTLLAGATPASSAPNVALDILQVHSLVAQVTEGGGEPSLIIRPRAASFQSVDMVIRIAGELTLWLERTMETGAEGAATLDLVNVACAFSKPQFAPATVTAGTDASTGEPDPPTAAPAPGPGLHPTLLRNLRDGFGACLVA